MRDYVYTDAETGKVVVICVGVDKLIDADYLFKEAIGAWPWKFKHVYGKGEPTCIETEYIAD